MTQIHYHTPCSLRKLTLAVTLAFTAFGAALPAWAADTGAPKTATSQDAKHKFNIPAQPLANALNGFIAISDWQVGFPAGLGKEVRSNAINGSYTSQQALDKLLQGTGLSYRLTGDNRVTLEKRVAAEPQSGETTLKPMTVVGEAVQDPNDPYNPDYRLTNSSTATKTDTPIMETPFSVKAIPKQVMEDQQVIRVDKAVENVSGVIRSGANALQRDTFIIRGFDTGGAGNTYRNGVIFSQTLTQLSTQREVANLERVEVLKGPASLLFGRAEPGGVINYITKQPLAKPYYALQQQFGSYDLYRTTADATGPITKDEKLLYRFNLAYENANSYREFANNEQVFVAPVLKWVISPQTRITFELEYQHWDSLHPSTFPLVDGKVYPFPASRNFSGLDTSKSQGDRVLGGFNWSHDFNDNWTLNHTFQVNSIDRKYALGFVPGTDAAGNSSRYSFPGTDHGDTYFTSLNLTGKFNTGILKHTSLFGFDYFRLDNTLSEGSLLQSDFNVFAPNYNVDFAKLPQPFDPFLRDAGLSWYGLYYQDQVELPFNLFALGGVRYDASEDTDNLASTTSNNNKVSPRGGLLWRPIPELSIYGSYTENFGAANGFDGNGRSLAPQTAQQWEIGTKTELWDGRFSATLAYYDLKKQNIAVTKDFRSFTTIGAAESRGLELDVAGQLLPGWKIIGGYAYMPFADITQDVEQGNTGNRLPLAPVHSGSIWNTYEFQYNELRGLKFGAGVVAAGQRQGSPANNYQLPGYATVNLLASYSKNVGKSKVTAQLNVDNLFDKTYYTSNTGNEISPLASRTFMGSVRVEF